MTSNAKLVFLMNDAGEEEGLGDAGVETYRDAPYASVARECGQNSADARERRPVIMRFDLLTIGREDYPAASEQLTAVCACLNKARAKRNEKETDFFMRAEEVLRSEHIKILRISDANTKGLIGPATPGTPFHSLVKASGVSNKDSDTSGGSFGIGKKAAFAASELQTVFYSTVYEELTSQTKHFLAQGKTLLVSHTASDGSERRATGYWGLSGFLPIDQTEQVPYWLRRDEVGTSVLVIGFREVEHWYHRIAASLIQNFFCAIHRGDIQFLLDDGRVDLNSQTLSSYFSDSQIVRAADVSDQREEFEFARNLYECLTSAETVSETVTIESLGQVSLRILLRDGFPKRVCIVRNGMAITDNLAHFGEKFARFPLYKEFVALVEPIDPQGSALIKRLENPKHDSLSAERLTDAGKRTEATRAMKKLAVTIRAAIKQQALPKPADVASLDELAKYFAANDESDKPPEPGSDENPETFKITTAARRDRRRTVTDPNAMGHQGGRGSARGRKEKGAGRGKGTGRGSSGSGRAGSNEVSLVEARNTPSLTGDPLLRTVYFTPEESCNAKVTISATGIDDAQALTVAESNVGQLYAGSIQLQLHENERTVIDVKFSKPYGGPLEITASRVSGIGSTDEAQ